MLFHHAVSKHGYRSLNFFPRIFRLKTPKLKGFFFLTYAENHVPLANYVTSQYLNWDISAIEHKIQATHLIKAVELKKTSVKWKRSWRRSVKNMDEFLQAKLLLN